MPSEKKRPFAMILILVVNILLVTWSLHSFAAKSIENAMGTSRDSDYKITIKEESAAIGDAMWPEISEGQ